MGDSANRRRKVREAFYDVAGHVEHGEWAYDARQFHEFMLAISALKEQAYKLHNEIRQEEGLDEE